MFASPTYSATAIADRKTGEDKGFALPGALPPGLRVLEIKSSVREWRTTWVGLRGAVEIFVGMLSPDARWLQRLSSAKRIAADDVERGGIERAHRRGANESLAARSSTIVGFGVAVRAEFSGITVLIGCTTRGEGEIDEVIEDFEVELLVPMRVDGDPDAIEVPIGSFYTPVPPADPETTEIEFGQPADRYALAVWADALGSDDWPSTHEFKATVATCMNRAVLRASSHCVDVEGNLVGSRSC